MAEKITKEADQKIEEDLQRKREITLANTAIDDVKAFLSSVHLFIIKVYGEFIEKEDLTAINEDLVKVSMEVIFSDEIY